MNKLAEYIKNSVAEMRKVTWPSKKETYSYTLLVIGISVGLATFLGLIDFVFSSVFDYFITNYK